MAVTRYRCLLDHACRRKACCLEIKCSRQWMSCLLLFISRIAWLRNKAWLTTTLHMDALYHSRRLCACAGRWWHGAYSTWRRLPRRRATRCGRPARYHRLSRPSKALRRRAHAPHGPSAALPQTALPTAPPSGTPLSVSSYWCTLQQTRLQGPFKRGHQHH